MEDPFDVQQRLSEKKKKWVKLFSTDICVLDTLMMKGVSSKSNILFFYLTVKTVIKSRLICKLVVLLILLYENVELNSQ